MKMLRSAIAVVLLFVAAPALAQWQTPNHSVPIGKGSGYTGFGSAAPGVAGQPFVSNGAASDPGFGTIANSGFTAGAANTVKGSLNGTTVADLPVPSCTPVSQAIQYTPGVGWSCGSILTLTGYDMPINLGLSSSAVGGALTITLTTANGAAPSVPSPVLVPLRSLTATSGTVTWSTISSTLTLTIPSGATLGTSSSNVPFRVWIFLDANGGTPAIGVATCSNTTTIFACSSWESTLKTSVAIGAGSTAAGTLYAAAGVTLDAVRIIGYCDYASGLATAGTWASSCTALQVFGPGVARPGTVVQGPITATSSATTAANNTTKVQTALSVPITRTSPANLIRVIADGSVEGASGASVIYNTQLSRDASPTLIGNQDQLALASSATTSINGAHMRALDAPGIGTTTTYYVYIWCSTTCTAAWNPGAVPALISVEEIMGALDPPANDNAQLSKVA